jgi:hypothetical protein
MPTKAPDWFKTIPQPSLPVGAVLPCAFVDTDDAAITIVADVPADGSRWTIDVGVDENHNGIIEHSEFGTTLSFIQEGGQVRLTISDMKSRPPSTPRWFRARRVS